MKRRSFIKAGILGAAGGAIAAPSIVSAQQKTFSWKMTNAYGPGSPFYVTGPGSPTDFCDMVKKMSGGRLQIQHFAAGELIPALEGFDAVSKGIVEMNAANSYFWSGKTFAAQYFTAVPFGLNFQGMNAWLYHGGGQKLWDEVYAPFNLVPMAMGNTGVQMTGWFRKPIEKIEDFKGLKMRIPGLAGKVLAGFGVDVKLLPGGEIFPALERGVIDAAEFVGPYQDRRLACRKPPNTTTRPAGTRRRLSPNSSSTRLPGIRFPRISRRSSRRPQQLATRSAIHGAKPPMPKLWTISSRTRASLRARCRPTSSPN